MNRPSSLGAILLVVLIAGLGIRFAVVNPLRNYLLDFRAYYAAGRALQIGVNPYDAAAVRERVQLPGRQNILTYLYPPPTLAVAYAFAKLPYPAAQVPWAMLQFLLGIGALALLWRATGVAFGSPTSVLIAFVFLLSSAVAQLFNWGQFDMIVLALLAAAMLALARDRSLWAGVLVGLAAIAKVTPAAYVVVFLVRRDWKAAGATGVTIAAFLGTSYLLLGDAVFVRWQANLRHQPNHLASMISPDNMSLHGYVLRGAVSCPDPQHSSDAWIDLGPAAADRIRWTLAGLLWLATIIWMLRQRRQLSTGDGLAALVPVVLLSSPIAWMHHGVLLLVPLTVIVGVVGRQSRLPRLDLVWVSLMLLTYTVWPVQRLGLQLPDWLAHLAGPTLTYCTALTWLYLMIRYVPLKLAAGSRVTRSAHEPVGAAACVPLQPGTGYWQP